MRTRIRTLLLFLFVSVVDSVYSQAPTITSFSPTSGPVATTVTITGTNYSTTPANSIVWFGATKATVSSATTTELVVTVPTGATYQPISVTNTLNGLTGYSNKPFIVTFPSSEIIDATTFATKVDFNTGTNPYCAALGDIDGDGKSDLVVSNSINNTFSVLRNISTSGSISTGSFEDRVNFTTGASPEGISIADVDGDGKPDVIVANYTDNKISVFRNTSSSGSITASSFSAKVDFAVGTHPYFISIGDIDGDGKPDIAVTNSGSNNVSVLRNTCTTGSVTSASFATSVEFTTAAFPFHLAIGDIDGDGKPDIATVNINGASVSILRNRATTGFISDSSFAVKVDFATTSGANPYGIALGDINGDGKPDLAVTNSGSTNSVSIFRNIGTPGVIDAGSLAPKVDFATGNSPYSLALGDLDGDGLPDLATVNFSGNSISILKNTCNSVSIDVSSFGTKVDLPTGMNPSSVLIGDIDGDGKPDVTSASASSSLLNVFRNLLPTIIPTPSIVSFTPSSGTIGTSVTITGSHFSPTPSNNIVWFGAAKGTVTAATSTQLTVTVPTGTTYQPLSVTNVSSGLSGYSNKPFNVTFPSSQVIDAGSFADKVDLTTGTGPASVATGDIDGDGKPDLVVANATGNNISIFRNISSPGSITTGSFAPKVDIAAGSSAYFVVLGDIDGDGKLDITVSNMASNTVSLFRNISSIGSITAASFESRIDIATGSVPYGLVLNDFDGDGRTDMIVENGGASTISIYRNIGAPGSLSAATFAPKVDINTGTNPEGIASADIDGDGKPDLVLSNYFDNTVSILRNISSPGSLTTSSFSARVDFTTGTSPYILSVGDFDGDSKPDIATININGKSFSVFRNTSISGSIGTGSLSLKTDFSTGGIPYGLAINDLDGDGKPDITVANPYSNNVSVYKNLCSSGLIGSGSFSTKTDFTGGTNPEGVAICDLDGDGKPDIVFVNRNGNSISILRNTIPAVNPPAIGIITQPTCSVATGSVVLNGLPPTGTWTVTKSPGGTTTTGSGTSTTINGLSAGTYSFTVTNASAQTSAASANVVIDLQPLTPSAPVVGTIIQPICSVATGSVALSGLPATITWTLTRSPGGTITTGTGTTTTISSLNPGTYTYTVSDGICTSASSGSILINAQTGSPTAPVIGTITHPTCSIATGSVALSGLPAIGTWTLTLLPGGTTSTGTGTTTFISTLPPGTYTYTVTNETGCISVASNAVILNAQPTYPLPPVLGTITHPTCLLSTGSVAFSGLPSSGTWTITRSPGGTTTTGTGSTTTVSGISEGTFSFTITNSYGCTSTASSEVTVNTQPITPSAPVPAVTQPTCRVTTGTIVLSALPTGSWTLNPSSGSPVSNTGTSYTVSSLNKGTYSYTVTNASGCTSAPTANITINDVPVGVIPVITQKWNDVLICYNLNNNLDKYQWFKGTTPLTGETNDQFFWITRVPGTPVSGSYRVLTTDKDGCKNYSNTIVIGAGTKSISAYPNPVSDNVTIDLTDEPAGRAVISVFNQKGTKVLEFETDKDYENLLHEFSVESLDEGVYFVRVTVGKVNVYNTKIVVAK